jgi:hypothetical protein
VYDMVSVPIMTTKLHARTVAAGDCTMAHKHAQYEFARGRE